MKSRQKRLGEDIELWMRLAGNVRFANMSEPLILYKTHENSVCRIHWEEQKKLLFVLRRQFITNILGRDIAMELVQALYEAQHGKDVMPDKRIKEVIQLIVEVYDVMKLKGWFFSKEIAQVRDDMVRRVIDISRRVKLIQEGVWRGDVEQYYWKSIWLRRFKRGVAIVCRRLLNYFRQLSRSHKIV